MRTILKYLCISGVGVGLLAALPVSAQLAVPDVLKVVVSPQIPAPGETVRLEAQGLGTFLGDATITWKQDGKVVKSGIGERTLTFVAGPLGRLTTIQMTVVSATQGTITREFNFVPALVRLLWEADTSVPPLYRGKALYTPGSEVRVIAFPQVVVRGATVSPNNLSFQWKRGGQPVPEQSGKGRNTFTYTGEQLLGDETVGVEVYFDNVRVAEGSLVVPASEPAIVLYQRDPLRGVLWSEALPPAIALAAKEITVQAVPYFFSAKDLAGSLSFNWKLNGNTTTGPNAAEGLMTLRQAGQGSGQALLSVSLQNANGARLLQSAETSVRMVFGSQASGGISSFFGL